MKQFAEIIVDELGITKPIKLISREYLISSLRDYEFHLDEGE